MIKGYDKHSFIKTRLWWMLAVEQASFQSSVLKPVLNGYELRVDTVLSLKNEVYAVDASDIAVQDVEIEEEADVIVSEWMGYMLLYELEIGG
ncbi:hypothetical protein DY000_02042286 [Brassica cretica]|uniref:Uncharacterized protein n=1 Tax=Brassica cretica TaxID=69181 RepID=A0ABQ7BCG4_BRACR|nr:hypothetical protein DY000_02042286 [Brassica cretica]